MFEDCFDVKQNKKFIIYQSITKCFIFLSFPTFTKGNFFYAVFSFSVSNDFKSEVKNIFFPLNFDNWSLSFSFHVHCNEQLVS